MTAICTDSLKGSPLQQSSTIAAVFLFRDDGAVLRNPIHHVSTHCRRLRPGNVAVNRRKAQPKKAQRRTAQRKKKGTTKKGSRLADSPKRCSSLPNHHGFLPCIPVSPLPAASVPVKTPSWRRRLLWTSSAPNNLTHVKYGRQICFNTFPDWPEPLSVSQPGDTCDLEGGRGETPKPAQRAGKPMHPSSRLP